MEWRLTDWRPFESLNNTASSYFPVFFLLIHTKKFPSFTCFRLRFSWQYCSLWYKSWIKEFLFYLFLILFRSLVFIDIIVLFFGGGISRFYYVLRSYLFSTVTMFRMYIKVFLRRISCSVTFREPRNKPINLIIRRSFSSWMAYYLTICRWGFCFYLFI